jgi:hypothetical protein
VKLSLNQVAKPLNVNFLNMQKSMFKLVMKAQPIKVMAKPFDMNPSTKLWVTITNNSLLCQHLSEYMKLTNNSN